ncbi:MAG: DUF2752 domain-containing protein [Polyangiaceae bacterium]|nr:DUF2752 domain-containing protein [Polyangiaceae bacterium]
MCPFAAATGVPCPGCGLTRASVAALSGHLGTALALQPFAFVVTPLFGTFAATVAFTYVKTGTATLPRRVERKLTPALYIVFISMISFWIARFFGVWGGPVPV